MSCRIGDCPLPSDPETDLCEFHADLVRICRTNMEMAKHQSPPKRIPKCRRCTAKMVAQSWRPGKWEFYCPNGCEYCYWCRRYIHFSDKCRHGVPTERAAEQPEMVI